jgi:hypothetical protein
LHCDGTLPTAQRPAFLPRRHEEELAEMFTDEDLCPSTPFYDELTTLTGAEVVYDLVVFVRQPDQQLGLETIKFLPLRTGGRLLLYPTANPHDSSSLPQDMYATIVETCVCFLQRR